MITWDDPTKLYYQHGLDRGVLYLPDLPAPIAWNGLISVDEGGEGTTEVLYRDGVIYLADAEPGDHTTSISAMMYPDPFSSCIGIPKATDGLYVDNQKPTSFGLSYRTLVGNGSIDDRFGYQIHLLYNCVATIKTRKRNTIGKDVKPMVFDFDVVCTPVKLAGYRPTAHFVIDTRGLGDAKVAELEALLYGSGVTPGRLPTPIEIYDILNFGDAIVVTDHLDGTFTIEGAEVNVVSNSLYDWVTYNINATAPAPDGSYVISTGGNTTVNTV